LAGGTGGRRLDIVDLPGWTTPNGGAAGRFRPTPVITAGAPKARGVGRDEN
jgi:hypothetical protein